MADVYLLYLPREILMKIIKYLTITDVRNVMLCCKTLKNVIIENDSIWKTLNRNLIVNDTSDNSDPIKLSWYNRTRISHNWCRGIYKNKGIITHPTKYMPWLKYCDSSVLLLSIGSELKCYFLPRSGMVNSREGLWKVEVPKVKRWSVQTNDISRFVIRDNLIACGNRDGCVAVYLLSDIKQKPLLLRHLKDCHNNGRAEVSAVELITNKSTSYVLTGSNVDNVLSFWSTEKENSGYWINKKSSKVFVPKAAQNVDFGGYGNPRCLAVNKEQDKVAIGLKSNSKPHVLDVNTMQLIWTTEHAEHDPREVVRDIQWHDDNLITYVHHKGIMQCMDTRTNKVVYEIRDPFQSSMYCVKSDGDRAVLVGVSEYTRCVLYDLRSTRHVQLYYCQKMSSPIYCLDFDSTKLIAAADRSVAILNFNVNVKAAQRRDYSEPFEFVKS